jgi:hypothetical protein
MCYPMASVSERRLLQVTVSELSLARGNAFRSVLGVSLRDAFFMRFCSFRSDNRAQLLRTIHFWRTPRQQLMVGGGWRRSYKEELQLHANP